MAKQADKITMADVQEAYDGALLLADREIVRLLAACILANQLEGPPVWILIVSSSSGGKCFAKGTKILMSDGTLKNVEDVVVGDVLVGDNGTTRTVSGTTSGREEMFRVSQRGHGDYVVNRSHILTLKYTSGKRNNRLDLNPGDIVDMPLETYLSLSDGDKKSLMGFTRGAEFDSQPVEMDPYLLGLWLGDGHRDTSVFSITKNDTVVRDAVSEAASQHGLRLVTDINTTGCHSYRASGKKKHPNPLTQILRAYGLHMKKFVPDAYKNNSREVRLQILAGILDTDGHLSENRRFDFISKDKQLSEDVVFLARSLGFSSTIVETKKGIKSTGFVGTYWRVNISGDLWTIPTRIPRKTATKRLMRREVQNHGITVESVGEGEYYGFQVGDNGRFLLGDFTVVHNSELMMTLDDLEFIPGKRVTYFISDLTENTLASGFKSVGGDASLLSKMPIGGMFMFKDFTSLLTKRQESRAAIMGQLREVYDRKFDKMTGNNQNLTWTGKIGALAGVTEAVHEYIHDMSIMGDRFMMYSMVQPNRKKATRFVMDLKMGGGQKERVDKAKAVMHDYLRQSLAGMYDARAVMRQEDKDQLVEVADFVTQVRSGVVEDERRGHIKFVPSPEMPFRLIDQLLSVGTALSHMKKSEFQDPQLNTIDMALLYKIAFDSIPLKRRWVLRQLATYTMGVNTAAVAKIIGYETEVVKGWLSQLAALKIARKLQTGSGADQWVLNEEYRQLMVIHEKVEVISDRVLNNAELDEENFLMETAMNDFAPEYTDADFN